MRSRVRGISAIALVAMAMMLVSPSAMALADEGNLEAGELSAQADNIAEGTWGTCPWEISADGVLTVHPGVGAEPDSSTYNREQYPWTDYRSKITAMVFAEEDGKKVVAPSTISYLCTGSAVTSVDLSGLDTSHVTDMSCLFSPCESLESLDLSGIDTSNVTDMSHMFWKCHALKSLDLSGFDTSSVTQMGQMFDQSGMVSIDVSSFDTSKVTSMVRMFSVCSNLSSLDLSSFDTSNVEYMSEMFYSCESLETIYVGEGWTAAGVKGGHLFSRCFSLVGGAGTAYDEDRIGSEYARVDGGPDSDTPGYLTLKLLPVKVAPTEWKRLYGDIALDTMAAIVREGFAEAGGTVVVATFDGYWDALAAAGLAGLSGAPVLMTGGAELSGQTSAELARLAPSKVFVCGGPAAVSDGVCDEIADVCGVKPVRIYGENAVSTAAQIDLAAPAATGGLWSGEAFLCTSDGYWDALAAAPVAYALHMPIFLTEPDGTLSDATLDAIRECGISQVHIAGGAAAVSASAEGKLGDLAGERFAGEFAVQTSEAIARFGISRGMSADNMGVATTGGYWDALAGAALCGKMGSVLVLVGDAQSSSIDGFVAENSSAEISAYVFGGPAAVSDDVVGRLKSVTAD